MYSSATVEDNLTKGEWYIEILVGFGIPNGTNAGIYLKVVNPSSAVVAEIEVYGVNSGTGSAYYVGTYDITITHGGQLLFV